jgi:hypothetical protein
MTPNIYKTAEQVELDSGINIEDLASDMHDIAKDLEALARYLEAEAELNITYLDDTQFDLVSGDMEDKLTSIKYAFKRMLAPYQTQLLINFHEERNSSI